MSNEKATINLYCCGGTGTNIGKGFENVNAGAEPGFAKINPVYIDTSKSNKSSDIPDERFYHIADLDGSGMFRKENHEPIQAHVRDILLAHKPTKFNIVISSGSGGSGSVISPTIVSELLSRGENVVVIVIGTTSPGIALNNTINTIKSFEAISRIRKKAVIAAYFENGGARADTDKAVTECISLLAAFFSGENAELDTADIQNWIDFPKVTSATPKLMGMVFKDHVDLKFDKGTYPLSAATLTLEGDEAIIDGIEYQVSGIVGKHIFAALKPQKAIHAILVDGLMGQTLVRLEKTYQEMQDKRSATVSIAQIKITDSDISTENGLVM